MIILVNTFDEKCDIRRDFHSFFTKFSFFSHDLCYMFIFHLLLLIVFVLLLVLLYAQCKFALFYVTTLFVLQHKFHRIYFLFVILVFYFHCWFLGLQLFFKQFFCDVLQHQSHHFWTTIILHKRFCVFIFVSYNVSWYFWCWCKVITFFKVILVNFKTQLTVILVLIVDLYCFRF